MERPFDTFVLFAEMRTGSNFLEANLNGLDGVTCHGEAFNPHFIGYPNRRDILGVTQSAREKDPLHLLSRIRSEPGLMHGFRYFHDHDPRVLTALLEDRRCAKIILTRHPVDSYISWKIAQATDQWKLTDLTKRKRAQARFDKAEFERRLLAHQHFQRTLAQALQRSGQAAFYIKYDDLGDLECLNGLAAWLGIDARLRHTNVGLKRQNPEPWHKKVVNFDEMSNALQDFNLFERGTTSDTSLSNGPKVPDYIAAAKAPLLYLPITGGPHEAVLTWLSELDHVGRAELLSGFNQKSLKAWLRTHPRHRRFTVLSHPVARAYATFCNQLVSTHNAGFEQIRRTLSDQHNVPLPDRGLATPGYDAAAHKMAFKAFLHFLEDNLAGKTSLRIDPHWDSQLDILRGVAKFAPPDVLLREEDLPQTLTQMAGELGHACPPPVQSARPMSQFSLEEIYDDEIEKAARRAYPRDYLMFGFTNWRAPVDQAALTRSASVKIV